MLSQAYPPETLRDILIPHADWHPFPTADERGPWEGLPQSIRDAHIARGEQAIGLAWPPLLATRFLEYAREGNRRRYERESFGRRYALCDLVIAECMEGEGRFLDDIVNGIWATCEESFWGVPAHIGPQKAGVGLPDTSEPIVDLFAAETGALLAWASYLMGPGLDNVSPLVRPRIAREIESRILVPCLEREDFWWMGFGDRRVNNWCPWINSNWLTMALLIERDDTRRLSHVEKILKSIDRFIDPYPGDGGCDEGPGYWGRAGASLFDCLELLLSATDGAIDLYDNPLIADIGRFIYRVHIHEDYYVNFADASAIVRPAAALVYRYGKRIGDGSMTAHAAWSAKRQDVAGKGTSESIGRQLPGLFVASELLDAPGDPPLIRDTWLGEIQVMTARDNARSAEGYYVAAKGGHNAESHNHNDVGNVVVYIDGKPVLIDAGVETYSRKTFSGDRYDIWTMQSGYHSLPAIDGAQQSPGQAFAARSVSYQADDGSSNLSMDIAGAYPEEAGIRSWTRAVALTRGQSIDIQDSYYLSNPAGEITLSLLTPCEVTVESGGRIALNEAALDAERTSGTAVIHYDGDKLEATAEALAIGDPQLQRAWGDRLTRILLRADSPPTVDTWTLRIKRASS